MYAAVLGCGRLCRWCMDAAVLGCDRLRRWCMDAAVLGCGRLSRWCMDAAVLGGGGLSRWGGRRAARCFAVALFRKDFLFFACGSRRIACIVGYWDVLWVLDVLVRNCK